MVCRLSDAATADADGDTGPGAQLGAQIGAEPLAARLRGQVGDDGLRGSLANGGYKRHVHNRELLDEGEVSDDGYSI